jgi:nifR3 family TIM-barrel protein
MENVWQKLPKPIMCLAPMEGVTDAVFRQVLINAGKPDLMMTEFTSVDGLVSKGYPFVAQRLKFEPMEKPLIAQIWGTKPDIFFQAAQILANMGFDGIDINMGCPVKDVTKAGGGAGIIGNFTLAREIILATKKGAPNLPVSVKTRIGRREKITEAWAKWLLESGIAALTIHGRTEKEISKVPAHWDEIEKVVNLRNEMKLATVILGNGDVKTRAEAMNKVVKYGVEGVMIGRGALENPWIFKNSKFETRNSKQEKIELLKFHMELFMKTWEGEKPFVVLRKYFKIYAHGFRGAVRLRESLMKAENVEDVNRLIG